MQLLDHLAEHTRSPSATLPSNVPSCRSLSSSEDGPSGPSSLADGGLAHNLQDSVRHRILYLSEQLRVEKASRDGNTVSYLKLVSKADRHQVPHIQQAFEKVNQRASATIAQIEHRLHQCHQQLQELEEGCRPEGLLLMAESDPANCEPPSEKALLSEPPEPGGEDGPVNLPHASRPFILESRFQSLQQGTCLETEDVAQQQNLLLQKVKAELEEAKRFHISLQESYHSLKERSLTDLQLLLESLQEEKCRQALMEEQVNGRLQGQLNEIYNLKHNLACSEERMAYLSYERAKEIWEITETFKSRISKLEMLQQVTQLEAAEHLQSRPPQMLFKFLSPRLSLATVLLVFVSTLCACPSSLISSRLCTCTMLMLIGLGVLAWQRWRAIPATDWQEWVPSRCRLYSKDSGPPADGP
ncbi:testis-specific protein TEX28 isoform X2 [Homo sapiens]|uniref:testis-specific protein TEX28 isoform X2 n=1 Tax=Homo sapiens TaxID=9606 RepID=UPI0005D02FEB|nr:testis-specific protein TEX28 isoform X2 [Homo sapiens]XP_011529420.1 testis-specific protein TEX28 isoform X2 [Homo sapiens]|eukprot:XP_011529419.1 testis-specific protein TEX28 isoform X2 [Homo sapiens]